MVDVSLIKQRLLDNFKITGKLAIDHITGEVDVYGDVKQILPYLQFPVQFGTVTGSFNCNNCHLNTLKGAPRKVGKQFDCDFNSLKDLRHAPTQVGGYFSVVGNKLISLSGAPAQVGGSFLCHFNELTNLEGSPDHVGGMFAVSYDQNLHLLPLCGYNNVEIFDAPDKVVSIMKKYAGTGRPGALKAAVELIRAGYADNARW